ncbi:RNA polymerase sigma factor SigM [Nocardioides donggukensis]|uniref:RNA polymerase sigma factor SigM n=1 Tax=Nocardioides donggukensis TaxID=2774019 RepID=A0A927K639_9ACTN|nr:RNA polymerase sigma factor SigM [Nocardioides donggukensis]MBD8870997.1 RNA polymerase sigma factor SigM [Nocardioides donggukensis]
MSKAAQGGVPPGPDRSDRDLLAAHVAGDPDAFGELFARHRDRLWAVALRTSGNPEDAADALQDALISAFRRASGYRGDAAVTTWLHRVVVNACLDRIRHTRSRAADALPDDLEASPDHGGRTTIDRAPGPEARVLDDERRQQVLAALATLPPEQRAALVLVDMEGYPVAEAAAVLDCAVGTVKSRCARGRARLAPLLGVLRDPEEPTEGSGNPDPGSSVPSTDRTRGPPATPPATPPTAPPATPTG